MIQDAFTYPLRGSGRILLIIGAVLSVVLDFAAGAPLVGLVAWILGGAYFIAYYFDIIVTTVSGRDEPPDFPEVTDLYGDIIAPLLRSLGVLIVACVPLILVTVLFRSETEPVPRPAWWAGVLFAAFYYPMAILNVAVGDEFAGALPHRVLPDIIRAMPRYLLLVVLLVAVLIISDVASRKILQIPVAGSLISAGVSLYFIMAQARLAGLFYLESLEDADDKASTDSTEPAPGADDPEKPQDR